MLSDNIKIGFRNLFNRRLRSWLTIVGIFIGIAAVVSLIGLGEGLRTAITLQFGFLGTDVLSVQASGLNYAGPPGTDITNPLSDELAEKIERVNGVEIAFNRYIKIGTLEFKDESGIGMAISMPDGETRKIAYDMLNLKTEDGRLLRDGDGRKVLLGYEFSKESSYGGGIHTGDKILLSDISYEVIGIIEKKGSFLFDSGVFVNDEQLLADFGDDGSTNIIAIKVKDVNDIDRVKRDVEKLLRKERDVKEGEEDFIVESPQQTLEALDQTLFAVQLFVTIIALISLLVGGIGITNTMYTAVLERTKEIGIMKSIGAKNSSVFTIFFFEAGALGLFGGALGILLGLGLAHGLAALGRSALGVDLIQAHISPTLIVGALAFSFVIGVIAGILPAIQASRKNPVDSLRFTK